jgi:DNA-binding response OmpR family regulator
MVNKGMKKILIIDEKVFTQVCKAILELEGYKIKTIKTFGEKLPMSTFGLIITSYPFCIPVLRRLKEFDIPKIILIDNLDKELIALLQNIRQSFCMIKPIDYREFRALVKSVIVNNNLSYQQSVSIL